MFLSEYSRFFFGGGVSLSYVFLGVHFCFCCLMADFPVLKDLLCQCRSQVVCFVYVCSILVFCHRSRCVGVLQGSCCFRFLCSAGSIETFITQFMQWFLRMSLSWRCLVWLCLMCFRWMSAGQVLFLHTSFCFVSFAHDRQMVDGMRDGWGSVWTESQNLRH